MSRSEHPPIGLELDSFGLPPNPEADEQIAKSTEIERRISLDLTQGNLLPDNDFQEHIETVADAYSPDVATFIDTSQTESSE